MKPVTDEKLEGDGFIDIEHTAAFTRIRGVGDMFWLFYPTVASIPTSRPIILWLDGITGVPPSLLANFGIFGPLDINLNKRENSWVNDYNLLFVDAPVGTGFSRAEDNTTISRDLDDTAETLLYTIESFYKIHESYENTPLYIFGQGHGAQLAVALGIRLAETQSFSNNLKGVVIGNGIMSPALALTKLGFYLEELAYIDGNGRNAIEEFSTSINNYTNDEQFETAFDTFLSLGTYVNEYAGAIAVNLNYIIDKLSQNTSQDSFGLNKYLRDTVYTSDTDLYKFMDETIAPILGISDNVKYEEQRDAATQAFRSSFMRPAVDKVEHLLQNTNVTVTVYNGNLDAISNTPGQLLWVENLQWPGQDSFLNSSRSTLIVNSRVEGYFRQSARFQFYWINAAGQSVPLDSPVAMRRVLQSITSN
ncbi:unnamed protein product [Parnassius apollo]|uniref:(apollo) hypothetical protein n=1 Tax=Parnassius apollo TaxID=110799 RepID=A0A8S3WQU9_PARAO|nr:unnamed protein product [Parnassius apollo]